MAHDLPVLVIANKTYSSWSLRPWLALRWAGVAFEERLIPLGPRDGSTNAQIAALSPTGKVPCLLLPGGGRVWDSLAICEWAAEQAPDAGLWPRDPRARACARSAAAEMHSGFPRVRATLAMNLRRRTGPRALSADVTAEIARIEALWTALRADFGAGGPYFFGARPTIADAFFAPVATRFRTYSVRLDPPAQAWADAILADPHMAEWDAAAAAEPWSIPEYDAV